VIADRPGRPGRRGRRRPPDGPDPLAEVPSFRSPWAFWRRFRPRRAVLDALAEVGPSGMTPNALEVTTELSEPRLNAVLRRLLDAGLVTRRPAGGADVLRSGRYLLTAHAPRSLAARGRFSGPARPR
jgi:hypothetical protein